MRWQGTDQIALKNRLSQKVKHHFSQFSKTLRVYVWKFNNVNSQATPKKEAKHKLKAVRRSNFYHKSRTDFTGTNLLQTAAHEFGHSLGLSHTDDNAALMAPFYRGYEVKPKLNEDDIKAIQALYGKKSRFTNNKPSTVPLNEIDTEVNEIENDSLLCNDPKIDAIVTTMDNSTYVFKGKQYWKLTEDSVDDAYPRDISTDWDGLPGNLDGAFTWKNGKTYIFSRNRYWRFTDRKMDSGYPKLISKGFDGIPNNIDAAFVWSGNGLIYFFKNGDYYRFNPEERPPVRDSYPKPISNWEGIPDNIDDALKYTNGYTYFFKDGQYWRFDDRSFKVNWTKSQC